MRLSPLDLVVALRLLQGDATFQRLADELGVAPSQVHQSVERLRIAQLLHPKSRRVNRLALEEFLLYGARYAFPPVVSTTARGVPTAHAASALSPIFGIDDPHVWPSPDGDMVGQALEPLYPGAPTLRNRSPETYRLLTLFDALRIGQAREKSAARELLKQALKKPSAEA
ncbi:MAG: AsnC family protein [Gemmatimonadetes bacterium]|nr:AsnC family protein [Gemmatimonadota bacterium]